MPNSTGRRRDMVGTWSKKYIVPRPYRFRYVTDTSPKGESVEQLQKIGPRFYAEVLLMSYSSPI